MRPFDVALFKDGRPFSPGEGGTAVSVMDCPPPETLYGALRNAILTARGVNVASYMAGTLSGPDAEVLGNPKRRQLGTLTIKGPFWEEERSGSSQLLLPWPSDAIPVKMNGGQREFGYMLPAAASHSESDASANWPVSWLHNLIPRVRLASGHLGWPRGSAIQNDPGRMFLPVDAPDDVGGNLLRYLTLAPSLRSSVASRVVDVEPHSGIEKENGTGRVADGALYTAEFIRPRAGEQGSVMSFRFDVTAGADALPRQFVVGLGGERRPFSASSVETPAIATRVRDAVRQHLHQSQRGGKLYFRLLLLTPGLFTRNGWFPDGIDAATGGARFDGIDYQLISATIARPLWLSGWDLVRKSPKPSRPHVAPGAVYFLSASGGTNLAEAVMDRFWMNSIQEGPLAPASDSPHPCARMGMGIVLVGGLQL
ncbi:type III-B CRISPR module-associated Cmr3 family protein [Paludibaculum fermentans]|uniref:type III-B CRISPR module-associated Cmr3 family protein n=1 Tax=Paludibaculum fermentans TaxID=1473598 RepID=UPI003EBC3B34